MTGFHARSSQLRPTTLVGTLMASLLFAGCGGGAATETGSTATSDTVAVSTSTTTPTTTAPAPSGPPAISLAAAAPPSRTAAPSLPAAGSALAGLTTAQAAQFTDGQTAFSTEATAATGLGPVFNGKSCLECHGAPAPGGASGRFVTRFGQTTGGVFDPLLNQGGSLLQAFALRGTPVEKVPTNANTVTLRRTTTLYGLGLIEAIPDAVLLANAAAEKAANPSMAGLAVLVTSAADGKQHVGRFGWKCQQATVLDFAADAEANELGVTNALVPSQNESNGPSVAVAAANLEDKASPTTGLRTIDRTANFMRLLAPNPNPVVTADSLVFPTNSPLARGAQLFQTVGCASCHTPFFKASSSIAAIDGKKVWGFSDWLAHDVGTGDGIVQGNCPSNKIRTAPLIDVHHTKSFLHDGSALTVADAITRHAGEATAVTASYAKLSTTDQAALQAFVNAL